MRYICWDSETHLIKPGLTAPRLVCVTWAEGETSGLVLREQGLVLLDAWLHDDDVTLCGHNIWFDLGVIAVADPSLIRPIFEKLRKGLIQDTQLRQQLIDVAEGQLKFHYDEETGDIVRSSYHLADLSYRLNKRWVNKGADTWRLKYALLDGVPVEQWPEDAKKYAIDDAIITQEVREAQDALLAKTDWARDEAGKIHLPNQTEQHRSAWALHLMTMWGVRTDGPAVGALKSGLESDYTGFMEKLRPTGLFKIAPPRTNRKGVHIPEKITKNMKVIYDRVEKAFVTRGEPCPMTEGGRVATDRKTLLATADGELKLLAERGAVEKLLTTYVPALERGTRVPINPRYHFLMETGRTSCSGPNIQNPPRKGGVRECFVPRPGHMYVFCDYDTLELRALAQVCLVVLGHSKMAEALRRGEDLHLSLAAEMLGISVEEAQERFAAGDPVIKEYRQQAKPANFGFPGGMAADSFVEYVEGYGITLTSDRAHEIREAWFAKWPEMKQYFDFIGRLTERSDQLVQVGSGRVRGGASFCASANSFFQGLAADGAKEALWRVAWECYLGTVYDDDSKPSHLAGCRPTLFLHDEIGMEVPYGQEPAVAAKASAAADRLAEVMISAMTKWIPDVPISCKPVMVPRWFKGAEAVRVGGLLVPSRPEKREDGKTKWVQASL